MKSLRPPRRFLVDQLRQRRGCDRSLHRRLYFGSNAYFELDLFDADPRTRGVSFLYRHGGTHELRFTRM